MYAIHNEQVKLTANWLNTIAIALVVTGLIVPAASYVYGLPSVPVVRSWIFIALSWFAGGVILHPGARRVL